MIARSLAPLAADRLLVVPLALEFEDLAREVGPVDEQRRQTGNLTGRPGRAQPELLSGLLAFRHHAAPSEAGEYGHRHVKGHQQQW